MKKAPFPVGPVTLFIVAMLGLTSSPAIAQEDQCGSDAASIVQTAYPDGTKISDETYSVDGGTITLPADSIVDYASHKMVCRIWPANPQYRLVAVPLIYGRTGDATEGDLDLLVLDTETHAVIARTRLADRMSDDAVRIYRVAFDTAFYRLAPGRIAFGLRIVEEGSSRVNPFMLTTLWLFDMEGEDLRAILDNVVVDQRGGEWDGNCDGEFYATTRTLAMAPRIHNGHADIIVSTHAETSVSQQRDGQCTETLTDSPASTDHLIFDGTQYTVPEALTRGW
ncbi:hypothetical protein [Pelagibacterium halotolerans]|uniref:Uncharacterized protein n=1 Tax=Pelagibacterium halotolerans (strain DSM 22347 / JCM 15775 / CGMCC 1.7692 / B2) TaxID=1082931 RepID=G4R8M7_PELHB|nr:hypothetical protein [Pelagibacterium halotolerans]AEQ50313.1 hypothetical protein KKY_268 [Pelagibacterium halotolerans B2]QJR19699.1 hypothetical protein HKM20_15425 [Pelagibacterium halotolerans]SEA53296.1 hypothetical protein SAMN05428936_104345 [Pelagibacterium halotolerans]